MQVRWIVPLGMAAASVVQVAYATQYLSVEQAQRAAFASATEFRALPAVDPARVGMPAGWSPQIFQARAADQSLGWLFVDQVIGKNELITYALALDNAGAVLSVEVLEYRESHGGEIRMPAWRKQFVGKTPDDKLSGDIRNISGATLSCRHLTEGVQRLLNVYKVILQPTVQS